jgi:hypothetical protein
MGTCQLHYNFCAVVLTIEVERINIFPQMSKTVTLLYRYMVGWNEARVK